MTLKLVAAAVVPLVLCTGNGVLFESDRSVVCMFPSWDCKLKGDVAVDLILLHHLSISSWVASENASCFFLLISLLWWIPSPCIFCWIFEWQNFQELPSFIQVRSPLSWAGNWHLSVEPCCGATSFSNSLGAVRRCRWNKPSGYDWLTPSLPYLTWFFREFQRMQTGSDQNLRSKVEQVWSCEWLMHPRFRGLLCQKRHKAQIHKSLFWRKNIPPQAAHDIGIPLDSMDTTVKLFLEALEASSWSWTWTSRLRGGM